MATKKTIPIKQVTSWSYSRYYDYKTCPLKFKLKHIDKLTEPPNAAMERGTQIHKLAEDYLKGRLVRLPTELKPLEAEFKYLRPIYKKATSGMLVEDQWAFTREWTLTAWNDWDECWVRLKIDALHYEDLRTIVITDWKSGRFKEEIAIEYIEQLELYALAVFLQYPQVEVVKPRLGFIDVGLFYPRSQDKPLIYTRKDVPRLKQVWERRVTPLFKDRNFAPRPNDSCRYCYYGQRAKAKGGPGRCKY